MPASSRNRKKYLVLEVVSIKLQLVSIPSKVFSVIVNFKYLHAQKASFLLVKYFHKMSPQNTNKKI